MARIEKETIDKIRTSTDIVDLIGSYLPLTEKGKNFFCVCPFHDDHSPSMSVSREKQIYSCFSCGATGNVFTFLMDYENMSFVEAVSYLGEKLGIHVNTEVKKVDNKYKDLYDAYNIANLFYKNNLMSKEGKKARDYLESRGIDENIIKKFEIGASLSNSLKPALKSFNENKMIDVGLLSESDSKVNDVFKNRVMFPLHDNEGNVVGFSGRIFNDDDNNPKYVNTKETNIFKKGKMFYNFFRAKEIIRKKKEIIICEGFMDVIRLDSIGIDNAVALMGTSFTSDQLNIIKRLKCNVVLNLDRDDAGEKATHTIGNMLKLEGINTTVIYYEGAKDSDEYILKYGKDKFLSAYKNKINFVDFEIDYLKKSVNINDSVELSKYINTIIKSLEDITDPILIELKVKELSEKYGINESTITSKLKTKKEVKKEVKKEEVKKRFNKYEISEIRIIYLMLNYPEVINIYENNLGYLASTDMTDLANEIVYYKDKYKEFDYSDFITYIDEKEELKNAFKKVTLYNNNPNYTEKELDDYLSIIRDYSIKSRIDALKKKMKETYDIEEKRKIASKIEKMKKEVLKW